MARDLKVVIVGAGIGGIATAIELGRHGLTDVMLLERAEDFGGTWYYNSYPGAACDVPSQLYSFSYAQRRDWSRLCSPQDEILSYLHGVAREHGLDHRVVTGAHVTSCSWDDASLRWTVAAEDGREWEADALVLATGQLHQPAFPRIEGREDFAGHSFHSAAWDHNYDLTGKRVAVIGTGASAVQFVPEIAEQVSQMYVFQRTGNWFMPRKNRRYPAAYKAFIKRVPGYQAYRRGFFYHYGEFLTMMIRHPGTIGRLGRAVSGAFMRRQLADAGVRQKAWPDYTFGCKRVLFSSKFLPALQLPHVELITDPVVRITPTELVTDDGVARAVDCVIYGTGFRTNDFMFPMEITGAGGVSLRDVWSGGPSAHNGICVPGFPSMFIIYGPNTNTSGGSIIYYEEKQAAYVRQALQRVRDHGAAAIDVRPEVAAAADAALQARFEGTAWTQCDSWYRDKTGRIVTNWPGYMREYSRAVRTLDASEFTLVPLPDRAPVAA